MQLGFTALRQIVDDGRKPVREEDCPHIRSTFQALRPELPRIQEVAGAADGAAALGVGRDFVELVPDADRGAGPFRDLPCRTGKDREEEAQVPGVPRHRTGNRQAAGII